jgi:hypothetical protein
MPPKRTSSQRDSSKLSQEEDFEPDDVDEEDDDQEEGEQYDFVACMHDKLAIGKHSVSCIELSDCFFAANHDGLISNSDSTVLILSIVKKPEDATFNEVASILLEYYWVSGYTDTQEEADIRRHHWEQVQGSAKVKKYVSESTTRNSNI